LPQKYKSARQVKINFSLQLVPFGWVCASVFASVKLHLLAVVQGCDATKAS